MALGTGLLSGHALKSFGQARFWDMPLNAWDKTALGAGPLTTIAVLVRVSLRSNELKLMHDARDMGSELHPFSTFALKVASSKVNAIMRARCRLCLLLTMTYSSGMDGELIAELDVDELVQALNED